MWSSLVYRSKASDFQRPHFFMVLWRRECAKQK